MDLDVGEPGVVVDGGMDVVVAQASAHHPIPAHLGGASPKAMTTALRNATELLHVDVNQFPGCGALVATDHLAGRPIHPVQPMDPAAAQHCVTRRAWDAEDGAEAMWAELAQAAQFEDSFFLDRTELSRASQGPAAPILQARPAFHAIALQPLVRSRPRDA